MPFPSALIPKCLVAGGIACDHALSLYLCNLFSGGGHDTFLSQITCKKARIWTFSDWIGNNMDDLRCSHWPKRRHLLVVVDFSLHIACVMSSEYTREFVMKFHPLKYFPFHRILKISVKNSPII